MAGKSTAVYPKSDPFSLARAVRVLEAEFALAALVGDYNDTDMAARLQRPNSTSSASGFLMCSLITRTIGRAPISSSSVKRDELSRRAESPLIDIAVE